MTLQTQPIETPQRTAVRQMHAAGINTIAVKADGSKAPLGSWKQYQERASTPDEHDRWWPPGSTLGVGVVTGAVSGNLLMIEVEARAAQRIGEVRDLAFATGQRVLWDKLNTWTELSPSGGVHWFVRTGHPTPGNQKLATAANGEVLAETRGTGGYSVVAPSNGTVHASGNPWTCVRGGPGNVPILPADETEDIFALFATIGEAPAEFNQPDRGPTEPADGLLRPGDDFEAKTEWPEILDGWTNLYTAGHTTYRRRPGKNNGISATTGHAQDRDRFFCFTSSTEFEQEKPYTKFGAYALRRHGGDHNAAAAELRKQGFGDPPSATAPTPATRPVRPAATPITLEKAHTVFRRWLGDDYDTDALDAVLAAAACDQLDGDPLWLLLISGSGNAKTETVQALDGVGATITSTISSTGALLSATSTKEKTKDATGGLLRKMGPTGKLVIKDVTSILSMDRNARAEVLGAFREVYDGRWERNVGTDGGRSLEWRGRLIVIGAVTTAWDRAHDVIASMGDRFVLIRMDSTLNRQAAGRKAIGNTGHENRMRTELAEAAAGVLANIGQDKPIALTDEEAESIMEAANIVTLVRTGVDFDYRGDVIDSHAPEMPTRFAKQLAQVVRGGVALGMERTQAMRLAIRCARDSMPPIRLAILDDVAAHPDTPTKDVRKRLQKPRTTVDRQLQALHILGVLTVYEEPVLHRGVEGTQWRYTVSPEINPAAIKPDSVPDLLVTGHKDTEKRDGSVSATDTVRLPTHISGTAAAAASPDRCTRHPVTPRPDLCDECAATQKETTP